MLIGKQYKDYMVKFFSRILGRLFQKMGYTVSPSYYMIPPSKGTKWIEKLDINTIIDIGSNEGQFIRKISKILPERKIYAFEPIHSCYKNLVNSFDSNQVTVYNYALSDHDGKSEINISNNTESSSLLEMKELHLSSYPDSTFVKKEQIELKRLDDVIDPALIKPNILIKLDVQGYEEKVIAGGPIIFSKANLIIIETIFEPLYEGQWLFDNIFKHFTERNFKFIGFAEQEFSPNSGIPLFADAIFVRNDFVSRVFS